MQKLLLLILIFTRLGIKDSVFYEANIKNKKFNILVIRVNKNGDLCNSKPCMNCIKHMKKLGINKIYYSTDDNDIMCEKIKYIKSEHESLGFAKCKDFL